MFKVGEKVVCIDIEDIKTTELILYNTYTIKMCDVNLEGHVSTEEVIVLNEIDMLTHSSRFIPLLEFRIQKINKLLSKIR